MTGPRVSIVVTCFNLGRYLDETLASIAGQTYREFELCVVDDGSTDIGTLDVLARIESSVPVVRTENRGLPAARNVGVAHTSAEYICCVDADDILAPTLLERSVAQLDADPSVAFVSHWLEAFGDESWEWKPERCDLPALLDVNTVNGAALVRRSVVDAVGGWDETMRDGCEDWDFWITLVERGFEGAILPEVLFRYRRRADSMSRVMFAADGHARVYRRIVEKHAATFQPHLQGLIRRRIRDAARLRDASFDLREHLELRMMPTLARARDDVAAAEAQRRAWEQLHRIDLLRNQAEAEAVALRRSWSWRITKPLRALKDLLHPTERGRS